jgi:hypothetical protein
MLAEGIDVVILRICTSNGSVSFASGRLWFRGCLAFEHRVALSLRLMAPATWGKPLWPKVSVIKGGGSWSFPIF